MTNPVTPNIGLNKIDRTSPSTTYFDLEKYIDQNADAVDRFAGESSEAIGALEKRLDTEERREVVLQPGLQIVNVERSAPFKLSGIKGRTLVNLLGRVGNMNDLSKWIAFRVSQALDSGSVKLTIDAEQLNGGTISPAFSVKSGKYYIALTDIKNGNAVGGGHFYIENLKAAKQSGVVYATDGFKPFWRAYSPSVDDDSCKLIHVVDGAAGQYAYYKSVRIYEITAAEFAALDSMTPEHVAAKYPYVDSVQPVRNPYALRYGENLLPPFYEMEFLGPLAGSPSIKNPYEADLIAYGVNIGWQYRMPTVPNQAYSISVIHNGVVAVQSFDKEHKLITRSNTGYVDSQSIDYITDVEAAYINVILGNGSKGAGTYTFKNPILTLDPEAKPFKPREDSMLALQTDLYANPVTGANADEVFKKDGQYFKLAKWKKLILDGSFPWVRGSQKEAGYQSVYFESDDLNYVTGIGTATKFDGKIIPVKDWHSKTVVDEVGIYPQSGKRIVYLKIRSSDSGWGDSYTPTPDEIKAYFMGYKMYSGTPETPYNGTGTKSFGKRENGDGAVFWVQDTTPPTVTYPEWRPYQLVYQLATPTVEPIVSEGMLTFNEGDNQIEVGTGIVLREKVTPFTYSTNINNINDNSPTPSNNLQNKTNRILMVYADNKLDSKWNKLTNVANANGGGVAQYVGALDKSVVYSVTYLLLDKSPIVAITGSYADNEKTMLQVLTDSVQQNTTAVSVLMNKKADKDIPGWITPTLMNGWIPYATDTMTYYGYPTAQYMKDSQEFIHLRGLVKGGTAPQSIIFYLPEGYRPKENITFVTICYYVTSGIEQITRVKISSDGAVTYMIGPTLSREASWLSLNLPPFTVE
ncbi:hypothetical protein J14TS5_01580 [Paenibacillus lautus]|uniref:hypothetical protein n=1 Tax=Paenibacillus lautus TaxID=1401 RepID=UPI001B255583|nr:hypothetical protein [Paenibacillus lautus]GIO95072.1 hypothetical protein J14TS5_01580 [Paenibacillus lautus]